MMRNSNMIRLSTPMALLAPGAGSPKLAAQFTGVAYSGGVVSTLSVVVDVTITGVPAQMALLSERDRTGIIGLVDGAAVSNNQIIVKGKLFCDMPGSPAERIAHLAGRGFPYQMSVGLFGYTEESIPHGQTHNQMVNGKVLTGPLTVLRDGNPSAQMGQVQVQLQ
jgi:hypothetical protein